MKKTLTLRGVAFSALFAALLVVFGYFSIPLGFTPVPITLQTLAVMLAGGLLGARYGFFSMAIVVVMTAVGFPLLNGKGGMSAILGPTGGYVVMWPIVALLVGYAISKVRSGTGLVQSGLVLAVMIVFGVFAQYIVGVPWLMQAAGLSLPAALAGGFYPYIPGDLIKAAAATLIVVSLRQTFPPERLTGHGSYAVRGSSEI